jgi:hypothetical protein
VISVALDHSNYNKASKPQDQYMGPIAMYVTTSLLPGIECATEKLV